MICYNSKAQFVFYEVLPGLQFGSKKTEKILIIFEDLSRHSVFY